MTDRNNTNKHTWIHYLGLAVLFVWWFGKKIFDLLLSVIQFFKNLLRS